MVSFLTKETWYSIVNFTKNFILEKVAGEQDNP